MRNVKTIPPKLTAALLAPSPLLLLLLTAFPMAGQESLQLSLADALERAHSASPRLRGLEAQRLAAAADVRQADAARRPDVDLSGAYSRLSDVPELAVPQPDGTARTIFPNIPDNYSARIGVTVPLYTGGRIRSSIAAAGHQHEATAYDVTAGVNDLELEVTLAYWDLVLAGESRAVLERSIESFEAHLEDAENRRRFGLAAANEVLSIEVERDRARLQVLQAERARATAEANLERLLDLPPETTITPTGTPVVSQTSTEPLDELVARAISSRPERSGLLARLAAAAAAVEVERGARKPQVRASAGYDLAQPNRRILPPEAEINDSWDVTVSVVYNLFDGGKRDAAVARAEARAETARQRLEELDRGIRLEVTARHLELETARAGVEVSEKAVRAAEENVRVAGERYREGLIPSSERLDAETRRLRAGLDLTAARVGLRRAAAGLERAVGGPLRGNPP